MAGCTSSKSSSAASTDATTTADANATTTGLSALTNPFCISWTAAATYARSEVDLSKGKGPADFDSYRKQLIAKLNDVVTNTPDGLRADLAKLHQRTLDELDIIHNHNYIKADVIGDAAYKKLANDQDPNMKKSEKAISAYHLANCGN